jgi:hypothetical protein
LVRLKTARNTARTTPGLTAHGFGVGMIAGLVTKRFATLTHEKVRAGGKMPCRQA